MKYPFNTKKIDVTKEDWYSELSFPGGFVELVDMKCLNCDFETEIEADIVFECLDMSSLDYPCFSCSKCNKLKLVPKDVYNQIKDHSYFPFR